MINNFKNKSYVYFHCDSSGTPFYVDKGSTWRAYDFRTRSLYYKIYVKGLGGVDKIDVVIFRTNLSEKNAYNLEHFLIKKLRQDNIFLVNFDDGGKPSRYSRKQLNQFYLKQVERLESDFDLTATCLKLNVPELCEEEAKNLGAFWSVIFNTWFYPKKYKFPEGLLKWL